jgi:hypothetical protein
MLVQSSLRQKHRQKFKANYFIRGFTLGWSTDENKAEAKGNFFWRKTIADKENSKSAERPQEDGVIY